MKSNKLDHKELVELDKPVCEEQKALYRALAEKALAETEKFKHDAAKAKYEAEYEKLNLAEKTRKENDILSGDQYNHVYNFINEVSDESVSSCMSVMSRWSRLAPRCDITLVLTSPGGSIIPGMALFDFLLDLRKKGHKLTTISRGYSASMAGILLQAGTERVAGQQSWLLIHQASFGTGGKLGDVEDRVEWIKAVCERILDIFAERAAKSTNKEISKVRAFIRKNWERKDFWINSEDALKHGFVDRVE